MTQRHPLRAVGAAACIGLTTAAAASSCPPSPISRADSAAMLVEAWKTVASGHAPLRSVWFWAPESDTGRVLPVSPELRALLVESGAPPLRATPARR